MSAKRPYLIGLTGSIGMGKSTTGGMFADLGVAVWDADAAVHRLYEKGGAAVARTAEICPSAIVEGGVDRAALRAWVSNERDALKKLEQVVHPLVSADRRNFVETTKSDIVVLDIPLLLETGQVDDFDAIVVVTVAKEIQFQRVLSRPDMTLEQLELILARQMPDAEKQAAADVVIRTETMEIARKAVGIMVREIREQMNNA